MVGKIPYILGPKELNKDIQVFYNYLSFKNLLVTSTDIYGGTYKNFVTMFGLPGCIIMLTGGSALTQFLQIKKLNIPIVGLVTQDYTKSLYDYPLLIPR